MMCLCISISHLLSPCAAPLAWMGVCAPMPARSSRPPSWYPLPSTLGFVRFGCDTSTVAGAAVARERASGMLGWKASRMGMAAALRGASTARDEAAVVCKFGYNVMSVSGTINMECALHADRSIDTARCLIGPDRYVHVPLRASPASVATSILKRSSRYGRSSFLSQLMTFVLLEAIVLVRGDNQSGTLVPSRSAQSIQVPISPVTFSDAV